MIYKKTDGYIELENSGCCCPPKQKKLGQHTNSTTSWWRINNGEWNRISKSFHHYTTLAEAAESVDDFLDAIKNGKY